MHHDRIHGIRFSLTKPFDRAFAPIDLASLVFFRVAFGLLMVENGWRHLAYHLIYINWLKPRFLFKYYGFSWVQPWPAHWLYIHWSVMGVLALFIAAGFLYRASAVLFFLSYTYFFLLDRGLYVNHTYLICLFSFLLIFVPANRAFSVDAWLHSKLRSETAPAWTLWLLRLQMGVVYLFAGIAKLRSPDWLHGEPLVQWLENVPGLAHVGHVVPKEWIGVGASYAAMAVDLFVVPLLLWRHTRLAAFCFAVLFHLINWRLFRIDVFPWLAVAATSLFLSPSWPRQVLSISLPPAGPAERETKRPWPGKQVIILSLVGIYALLQCALPLRDLLYKGGVEWACLEPILSWHMMLRRQGSFARFYVTDPNNGKTFAANPADYLESEQDKRMNWHPDMLVQFAHYLASTTVPAGPKPIQVHARLFVSLNGRKPQLFIDPNVDLAAEPQRFGRPSWLLEIHEPLPPPGQAISQDPFAAEQ